MTAEEFKKYEGKTTFGFVRGVNIDGCIVIGYDSLRNGSLIVGCHDSRGWICFLTTDVVDENLKRQFESFLYVNVENVKNEKDLGLTSILKGCEGVELWSDICGRCNLDRINHDGLIRVLVNEVNSICLNFLPDGRFYDFEGAKCLLWPSETNRDWSQFKKPIKVKDGEIVACADNLDYINIRKYSGGNTCYSSNGKTTWKYIIPFDKFNPNLSKEELKKLSIV